MPIRRNTLSALTIEPRRDQGSARLVRRDGTSRQRGQRRWRRSIRTARLETLEPRRVLDGNPVISEFMASNASTLQDGDGEYSDWVEIRNLDSVDAADLDGWYLTDAADNLVKWRFPATTLAPGESLVVFASGKNRTDPAMELHTNFKLSRDGEFLALVRRDGLDTATRYSPAYPPQMTDVSFGTSTNLGADSYFAAPTPAADNAEGFLGRASEAAFSIARGFYDAPLNVQLVTPTPDATIRYTLDGSEPSATQGEDYSSPITISTTTTLRTVVVKDLLIPSTVETATYIFVADVVNQGNAPPGYPSTLRNGTGVVPADYEMDPDVTMDPAYQDLMDDALLSIPTISLVTDIDNLFDPATGIYQNTTDSGLEWERPVSVELINPDGTPGFQIDAGVRIQGRASRQPSSSPKHSFRLLFKDIYGAGSLDFPFFTDADATDRFDTIVLRAGFNNSWIHGSGIRPGERERSQYVRDQWMKDTQLAMGHPSAHNSYAHLYLNGIYWGLYNPTERPSDSFAAAYFGGEREDYDIINSNQVKSGDNVAWRAMFSAAKAGLDEEAEYAAFQQLLELPSFIDYMILNHYGGNHDWGNSNFYAIRNRNTDGKFHFVSWDAESTFINLDDNMTLGRSSSGPPGLHFALGQNAEYRLLFADHIHRHLFNDGLLTPDRVIERWNQRSDQVFEPVVAESARWGDYRRDVDPGLAPRAVYVRDDHWMAERQRMLNDVFPQRTEILLTQYRVAGFYPDVMAPVFSQHGGQVDESTPLSITNPNDSGTVFYTNDGSDPRLSGGAVSPTALSFDSPFNISATTTIKSRILGVDGQWSALNEADFVSSVPATPDSLALTELNYHPYPPSTVELSIDPQLEDDDFEFIELRNVSSRTIDLAGVVLSDGVQSRVPSEAPVEVSPGERVLIVANRVAFEARYGTAHRIVSEFSGQLSNGGERIVIESATSDVIHDFSYDDEDGWPESADGSGPTLEVIDTRGDYNDPRNWRASQAPGGTPGRPGRVAGDANGDGIFSSADWLTVLQAGEYEDDIDNNSTFEEGDWDGDGDFTSHDIVFAMQSGLFVDDPP